jgi:hypothetical protein
MLDDPGRRLSLAVDRVPTRRRLERTTDLEAFVGFVHQRAAPVLLVAGAPPSSVGT